MILSAGKCVCIQGWIVTGICTNIVGCFVMQKASGINQCVKCIGDEFHLKNGICHCYVGYELVGSHCQSICGDGLIFTEACDDGNNISGDGCSSIC